MKRVVDKAVTTVLSLMVQKQYSELETLTNGKRLSAAEIERAIEEYGRKLIMPPHGINIENAIEVKGSSPKIYSVVVALWTIEEGQSDLSVEMTVIDDPNGLQIELDNIHVR
jgi:hypothetical protein